MTLKIEEAVRLLSAVLILGSVVATLFVHSAFLWVTVAIGVMLVVRALTGFCALAQFFSMLGLRSERGLTEH